MSILTSYQLFRRQGLTSGAFFRIRDALCPIDFILPHLPSVGTLLDIGCGAGVFSISFAKCRPDLRVVGVDINPRRVEKARAISCSVPNARFIEGDVRYIFPDSRFSTITMIDVVHHLPREAQIPLILWAYSHLEPHGRLVLKDIDDEPHWMVLATKIADSLRFPGYHTQFVTPNLLLSSLEKHAIRPCLVERLRRFYVPHILYAFERSGPNS